MNPKGKRLVTLELPFGGFGDQSNCDQAHTEALTNCISDNSGDVYPDLNSAVWRRVNFDMEKWNRLYAIEYADCFMHDVLGPDHKMWSNLREESGGAAELVSVDQNWGHRITVQVTRDILARIRRAAGRCNPGKSGWSDAIKRVFGSNWDDRPPAKFEDIESDWQQVILCVAYAETTGTEVDGMAEYFLMEYSNGNGYYDRWLFDSLSEKDRKTLNTLAKIATRRRDRSVGGETKHAGVIPLPLFALPLFKDGDDDNQLSALNYVSQHPLAVGGTWEHNAEKLARIASWGGTRAAAVLKSVAIMAEHNHILPEKFILVNLAALKATGLGVQEIVDRTLYGTT